MDRSESQRKKVANKTINRLRKLTKAIQSGQRVMVTRVTRYNTPDGPMHVRTRKKTRWCAEHGRFMCPCQNKEESNDNGRRADES